MQTLFSPKRDYRAWTRKRLPVVKELALLGLSREDIADVVKASVSTIQRDLNELRQRRNLPLEISTVSEERQKQLISNQLSCLEKLLVDENLDETSEALYHALRSWAETHHLFEQEATQTRLPFLEN
ncbi:MAG: hypothetical protein UU08_C0021G0007 [Candidatus Uhrbacteria bacterium GW2011_GWE2_40_58]|nr:MAG: hypothetical protein UT94_C0026G0007 [Candidatus Uhrbacteria bacterium GW2011_GWF2_40_263]KKR67295.1 MAG: hypothetical protein UU08_C0021G0007 [Candidatus Uhrbacteria bacterium GW2011_GWE2_40_58]OGL93899.1 MAG: hypothetical protein A2239_01325 [Candidatus Uhrbacteria bacterium RIFOXYA2_FULL_40_9]OGL97913.1 MAG: hypothetical protein A2332_04075 [Candidatus Uhrbacteria bacterium RIFOXYB2_FULL_41_18]HBK34553.1 hypothetical protein [Candidatus Uhrbacteria bacterium]